MNAKSKHLTKRLCICCQEKGKKTNKEHIFPRWVLKKTNTLYNPIRAGNKRIPGNSCVIPICKDCNSQLGRELEEPVKEVFERIEIGEGFNDYEAELMVRWLWKITGMFFWMERAKKEEDYGFVPLKDRCLSKIERPRERISIAISLIDDLETKKYSNQTPMGIDVIPILSNVLAAGVFNKIALLVYYTKFSEEIPDYFTKYQLSATPLMLNLNKRTIPKSGFKSSGEAVVKTIALANGTLLVRHEVETLEMMKKIIITAKSEPNAFPDMYVERLEQSGLLLTR